MSRWAEDNPLGLSLVAVLAVLVVVSLLLGVVWRRPALATVDNRDGSQSIQQLNIPQLEDGEPLARYEVITERPVFATDRTPYVAPVSDEAQDIQDQDIEDVEEPEIVLSGIVITPSIRMVTLQPKNSGETLIAFEGQPLEGDFGSWQVSSIEARKATLSSDNGDSFQLELQVHDQAITAPPKPKKAESEKAASSDEEGESPAREGGQLTRAEEIRQRIAQRREELRQASDDQEDESQAEPKPVNYQTAIQSMIRGGKARKQDDDEKQ